MQRCTYVLYVCIVFLYVFAEIANNENKNRDAQAFFHLLSVLVISVDNTRRIVNATHGVALQENLTLFLFCVALNKNRSFCRPELYARCVLDKSGLSRTLNPIRIILAAAVP